jgi:hypothetical protein
MLSPSHQLSRTKGTWFSTRALSFGRLTRVVSTKKSRACA